ncbi:MAG TPA: type II secretion system F family protein [Candidatus Binataceae bacterium]|nr:type II secretion system F family protein [Candidatus Binataceae bacterium]
MDLLLAGGVFALVLMLALIMVARGMGRADQSNAGKLLHQITQPVKLEEPEVMRPRPRANRAPGALSGLYRLNVMKWLNESLIQAGLDLHVSEAALIILLLFGLGFGLCDLIWRDSQLAMLGGLALAVPPILYVRWRRRRRLHAFAKQLPFALDLIKSSLEAGHSLMRGLQVVMQEFSDPLGGEFRKVVEQGRLGMSVPKAFDELLLRVPEDDLRLLVVAVKVQSDVGSSLANIIGRLSEIVRTRQRLHAQIHSMTAQSRMSGLIVGLLPIVVLALFSLIQPNYTHVLFHDPLGIKAVKAALVLDVLAFATIRRVLRVNY